MKKRLKKIIIVITLIATFLLGSKYFNISSNISSANKNSSIEELRKSELESMKKVEEIGKALLRNKSTNFWSYDDGLICVVDSRTLLFNHGHAGIVGTKANAGKTIEAHKEDGVQAKSGDWRTRYSGKLVQAGVTSTTKNQDHQAALWAEAQIGKPYNKNFLDISRRDAFYCSQLVWAAYYETTGVDLSDGGHSYVTPFELVEDINKVSINYYRE